MVQFTLLDAGIERIIEKRRARGSFVIIARDPRKAPTDQLQAARRRMRVQLLLKVGGLHEARHLQEDRIIGEPLVHERGEGITTVV